MLIPATTHHRAASMPAPIERIDRRKADHRIEFRHRVFNRDQRLPAFSTACTGSVWRDFSSAQGEPTESVPRFRVRQSLGLHFSE